METLVHWVDILALLSLGLMAGALVAEGALLVPMWLSMQPGEFLSWYKKHAALLQGFFGPVEIAAALLTITAAVLGWVTGDPQRLLFTAPALSCIGVLAVFPVYFQKANTSFRLGTIPLDRVQPELRRWSAWHWGRTWVAVAGFGAAAIAVAA